MNGKTWPSEMIEKVDPISGATVRQLTRCFAHNWHLYFTYSGWWDHDRRLVFNSHRNNMRGMYSLDLATYQITTLVEGLSDCVLNTATNELHGIRQRQVIGINIIDGRTRVLYELPEGFIGGGLASTVDGKYVCLGLCEENSVDRSGMGQGYKGFAEYHASAPLSQLIKIDLQSLKWDVILEQRAWFGHINPSPKRGELLTFCHEGPWQKVRQRIWGVNLATGEEVWPIRPQHQETDAIGHEFWLADGEHVAYQGWMPESPVFGIARFDNGTIEEWPFPVPSEHFYANSAELVVGDGLRSPYLLAWQKEGEGYSQPRVICRHRSSRHTQVTHVHPRISPDNQYVLYTSDDTGYGSVYQVMLPEFEALPTLAEVVEIGANRS